MLVFVIVACSQVFVTSSARAGSTNEVGTNSLYAVGHVRKWKWAKMHRVQLAVHLVFEEGMEIERSTMISFTHEGTNFEAALASGAGVLHVPSPNWVYFMATNSVLGPMELRDAEGKSVATTKPTVNAPEAYPSSYTLSKLWARARRIQAFPCVLVPKQDTTASVPEFTLEDYFKIEKPGHYTLAIWPRIYKRTSKGADTCERVDLPPVTIPFEWP